MEQDALYSRAADAFGPSLRRLAKSYEPDADLARDLLQDIHLALWRSFATFEGQCSLRSWVYRVAHNTAISLRLRQRVRSPKLISLEELAELPAAHDPEASVGRARNLARLGALIRRLRPPDDQVMLLYLEDLDAGAIGEITGLSPGAVATRVHRIKAVLARQFNEGSEP